MKGNHYNFKNSKMLLLITLTSIIAIATICNVVFGKYIVEMVSGNKQASVAEFYFLTDLAENTAVDPYLVYDGTINFAVRNYDPLNITEKNIPYTVSLTSSPSDSTHTISIDGDDKTEGILNGNNKSSHNIVILVDKDGDYTATVTSTSPYAKTITLYFRVNTHYANSFYTVTNHDGWIELDLYTGESSDNVTIAYGNLQPDNTIGPMSDWQAGTDKNGELSGLEAHSHYKLIFFGTYSDENNPFEKSSQNGKLIKKGA